MSAPLISHQLSRVMFHISFPQIQACVYCTSASISGCAHVTSCITIACLMYFHTTLSEVAEFENEGCQTAEKAVEKYFSLSLKNLHAIWTKGTGETR